MLELAYKEALRPAGAPPAAWCRNDMHIHIRPGTAKQRRGTAWSCCPTGSKSAKYEHVNMYLKPRLCHLGAAPAEVCQRRRRFRLQRRQQVAQLPGGVREVALVQREVCEALEPRQRQRQQRAVLHLLPLRRGSSLRLYLQYAMTARAEMRHLVNKLPW